MTTPRLVVSVEDVLPGQGVKLMARVKNVEAELLTQASVTSIAFTISEVQVASGVETVTEVEADTLNKTDVIFDTLQTDDSWHADEEGYNLAWVPTTGQLPPGGSRYRYSLLITPTSGPTVPVLWQDRKARAI